MTRVSEVATVRPAEPEQSSGEVELNHLASLIIAALATLALALNARAGAVDLLIAVAVLQAIVVIAWIYGTGAPGRIGLLVVGGLAAAGADVAVSVWPHGRLGTLLIVLALALPVSFGHQLVRGAARARIVESVGGAALVIVAVVGLSALLQLRHEFSGSAAGGSAVGGEVVAGVVAAAGGALVIGHLVDLVYAAPRFDASVPRGLLGVIASVGLGGSLGHLLLRSHAEFAGGRGAFTGVAVGAIGAFLAIGVAFIQASPTVPPRRFGARLQPVLAALLPLAILGPVAFLLCLVIRA
jgi:hypothetical protein